MLKENDATDAHLGTGGSDLSVDVKAVRVIKLARFQGQIAQT